MGNLRALVLASAFALAGAQAALAADLLPAPPPLEPFAPQQDYSGWYLRGDVGVGIASLGVTSTFAPGTFAPGYRYDESNLTDSATIGVGLGYQFNNWLRADVTGEYRSRQDYSAATSYVNYIPVGGVNPICGSLATNPRCSDFYHGTVQSSVFLLNGYADLGSWYNITPFVGAGVGIARNSFGSIYDTSIGNSGGGFSVETSKTSFAWALMAGLAWTVNPRLKLELGYRYLNLGRGSSAPIICQNTSGCGFEVQNMKLASQDIRLGMRWMFSEPEMEVAPPPPPLITKY